jgi:four helix bundle protein
VAAMPIRDFRDLIVWQKSVDLIVEIYTITRRFPEEEKFGITSQLRRAAVSVASNIAEGSGKGTTAELVGFLTTSRSSLRESHSLLIVSQRLDFLTKVEAAKANGLIEEVGKMNSSLRSKLRANPRRKKYLSEKKKQSGLACSCEPAL